MADPGDTPRADQAFRHELLEQWPDGVLKHLKWHKPAGIHPPPHRCCRAGTMFEWRKNTSSRSSWVSRKLASIDCRRIRSIRSGAGLPRLHLLVTRMPGGKRPPNASPTTCSAFPSP